MSETIESVQTTLNTISTEVNGLSMALDVIEAQLDADEDDPVTQPEWPNGDTFTNIPVDYATVFDSIPNICTDLVFAKDGKRLFVALMNEGDASTANFPACLSLNTDTWEKDEHFPTFPGSSSQLFLDPNGRNLYINYTAHTHSTGSSFVSIDLLTNEVEKFDFGENNIQSIAFSPDNTQMALHATITADDEFFHIVYIVSKETDVIIKKLFKEELGENISIKKMRYTPNSEQLHLETHSTVDRNARSFLAFDTTHWEPIFFTQNEVPERSFDKIAVSPDFSEWTFASHTGLVRQKREYGAEGPSLPLNEPGLNYITDLRYSPDGAQLAVAHSTHYGNNGLTVYNTTTGAPIANMPAGIPSSDPNSRARCVAWSPTKEFIAIGGYTNTGVSDQSPIRVYQVA